jgi:hypothetical protein
MGASDLKPIIPEHIFISFSQKDRELAEGIVRSLGRKNIPAWIDYVKLVPGTPDWESSVREAIEKSFAVVVLASPDSRESKFVRGELNLAELRGCQIYPVWIDGTDWPDCIPLGMTYRQYIDARGKRRDQGIDELCETLSQHIHSATPKHYLVSPLTRMEGKVGNKSRKRVLPPPGFVSVNLPEGNERGSEEGGSAAFIRVSDYSCIRAFLDDLYINYLKDRFEPFTYGSRWVLEEDLSLRYPRLLLVPWPWLTCPHASPQMENHWLYHTPLDECGLRPGTRWVVRMVPDVEPIGLATNDERNFRVMRTNPKAEHLLRLLGVLRCQSMYEASEDYSFRFVISFQSIFGAPILPGTAIVQTQKALPEDKMDYWLNL